MLLKKYELMFILKPNEDDAIKATVDKFAAIITDNGGSVEKVDAWGKRRLAYEIKNFADGYYVLINFAAEPAVVAELDRVMKITDDVLRHMIVKQEE